MTIAIRQVIYAALPGAGTAVTLTAGTTAGFVGGSAQTSETFLPGSSLVAWILNNSGNGTPTIADTGANSYVASGASNASTNFTLRQWVANNIRGGALTLTATQTASQNQLLLVVAEVTGTKGYDSGTGTPAGQSQATPGTGANAITTTSGAGNLTPTTQPGGICGLCFTEASSLSAGTGFASAGYVTGSWGSFGGVFMVEGQRYTATTAIPATWTNGSAGLTQTLAALLIEGTLKTSSGLMMGVGS